MINREITNNTIAKAVRVECDTETDTVYLVFEITDERFKQDVKRNWMQDIEVKVVGKNLVRT